MIVGEFLFIGRITKVFLITGCNDKWHRGFVKVNRALKRAVRQVLEQVLGRVLEQVNRKREK